MSNKEGHIKMLKYSMDKIENIDDYNKRLNYLNEFKKKGIIDQPTYVQLLNYLEEIFDELKLWREKFPYQNTNI